MKYEDENIVANFRAAVRLIDAQRKMLIEAQSPSSVTDALSSIVRHLHGHSDEQIKRVVGGIEYRTNFLQRRSTEVSRMADIDLDSIQRMLDDHKTTRSKLEAIAIGRFHVPKGSLRSFGNIDQLKEKIATLVRNELSHEAISRVAREHKS